MGLAIITQNLTEGLYKIQLQYDWTGVDRELQELTDRAADYYLRLLRALNSLDDLRRAKSEAEDGMNAVIQQWKDALIDKLNEEPPPLIPPDPIDPGTGEPWADTDRAQEAALLEAINAERTTAIVATLTRDSDLDQSILRHLRAMAASGRILHHDDGWTAADRAAAAGYDYDTTIGVGQVQAFGTQTPAATVAQWMRRSSDRTLMLDNDYTECGISYVYAPRNPYTYLWGAVLATPGPTLPTFTEPEKDAAQTEGDDADAALNKIELPTIETFEPDKLGEVAAEFGKAAQRVRAAENVVAELLIEQNERTRRQAELTALKTASTTPIYAWCCQYIEDISGGATVSTAEVPGFYSPAGIARITTMNVRNQYATDPPEVVGYVEQAINILPVAVTATSGKLHAVNNMTPSQTFHAAAMEPGAVRWKPLWRYGTILGINTGHTCTVRLMEATPRQPRGEPDDLILDADDQRTLTNIPIVYPPCYSEVFEIGVEVLVEFTGQDRAVPKVIGFRREPLPCPAGRVSWEELIE